MIRYVYFSASDQCFRVDDDDDDGKLWELSCSKTSASQHYETYADIAIFQADTVTGSGEGVSAICPQGTVEGLTYSNDTNAAFRSTGDFAGPCGQTYDNLPY